MGDVATGVKFLLYGDFSRFVIVDRVGLSVDVIPHLFGTNHRPTGQRGLYAFWRNGSKVVDANAFQALLGVA
jgi:HK97 family phage major capsid protein